MSERTAGQSKTKGLLAKVFRHKKKNKKPPVADLAVDQVHDSSPSLSRDSGASRQEEVTAGSGTTSTALDGLGQAADYPPPPLHESNTPRTEGQVGSEAQAEGRPAAVKRSLHVQVISARGVMAADSNGLSDPFCTVRVGRHKLSSRVVHKTLAPSWNEHFVFGAEDVEEALHDGRPFVYLHVFDWDMVSANDFLGQAEVEFSALETAAGRDARWLQLYRLSRSGKKKYEGEVQVAAWFEEGGERGHAGGSKASSLCYPPGAPKHVPMVVHAADGNSLYEEPLIACLAITLEALHGALTTPASLPRGGDIAAAAAAAASASASSGAPPKDPFPAREPAAAATQRGDGGRDKQGSPRRSPLGRMLPSPFRRKNPAIIARDPPGQQQQARRGSAASDAPAASSGVALFGEDEEEDDDLNLLFGGSLGGALDLDGAPSPSPLAELQGMQDEDEAEPGPEGEGEAESPTPALSDQQEQPARDLLSGHLLYCKMSLGRQVRQSFIKKERSSGITRFGFRFVFAVPVPVKNRQVAVELYRTPSSTRKGRLIASTQVWLYDLLPQLLDSATAGELGCSPDPARVHRSTHSLQSLDKKAAGSHVVLAGVVVDQDERRRMYGHPLGEAATAQASSMAAGGGRGAAPGGGAGARAGPPALQHLQSSTNLMSERERQRRAALTEEGYEEWQNRWTTKLMEQARGAVVVQAEYVGSVLSTWAGSAGAYMGWTPPPPAAPSPEAHPRRLPSAAAPDTSTSDVAHPLQPPAKLHLRLSSLHLPGVGSDCFLVLKCGPHWGRTAMASPSSCGTLSPGWELSMPLHDPSTLLLITVFKQPPRTPFSAVRGSHQPGLKTSGLIGPNVPQMVGKLRVRLSCVQPNQPVTAMLPLLSERKKGAQQVGTAEMTLQVLYMSGKALMRSYLRPPLPEVAYTHGVDDSATQRSMDYETRRIVLRWLDSTNPAIPKPVAVAVLDTEREEFVMSRMRVNFRRFQLMAAGFANFFKWWAAVQRWDNPVESSLVCGAFVLLAFCPSIVMPLLMVWAALRVAASKPEVAGQPLHMEHDPPEIEPEDVQLATTSSNPYTILMKKYEALLGIMLRVQNYADDLASALEKMQALGSWQDPIATTIYMAALLGIAFLVFVLGLSTVLAFALFWIVRPPRLRTPTPAPPANFFRRLPSRADRIM